MTDKHPRNRNSQNDAPSHEYGVDKERRPLDKDEEQAEAAEYGIYGYHDEPGEAEGGNEPEPGPAPPEPPEEPVATEGEARGGQSWEDTRHGAGFDQPVEEPQHRASRPQLPDSEEDGS